MLDVGDVKKLIVFPHQNGQLHKINSTLACARCHYLVFDQALWNKVNFGKFFCKFFCFVLQYLGELYLDTLMKFFSFCTKLSIKEKCQCVHCTSSCVQSTHKIFVFPNMVPSETEYSNTGNVHYVLYTFKPLSILNNTSVLSSTVYSFYLHYQKKKKKKKKKKKNYSPEDSFRPSRKINQLWSIVKKKLAKGYRNKIYFHVCQQL